MFSRKENLKNKCPNCKSGPSWGIIKLIDSAGRDRYPYFCTLCKTRTQCFCKKKDVPKNIITGKPNVIMPQKTGVCEKCGLETYVENHHFAPRYLFKDADRWPTAMLCRKCHSEWHKVINSNTSR